MRTPMTALILAWALQIDVSTDEKILSEIPTDVTSLSIPFSFSADGRAVAFVAPFGGKNVAFFNGKTFGAEYDDVTRAGVSADGRVLGYIARKGDAMFVVLNGKEGERFKKVEGVNAVFFVSGPFLSPDGSRAAYLATSDGKPFLVVGEMKVGAEKGKEFGSYSDLMFGPYGFHWICRAVRGADTFLIIDGKPGDPLASVNASQAVFSADGTKVAYVARPKEGATRVHVDGTPASAEYSWCNRVAFLPDGAISFFAGDGKTTWYCTGTTQMEVPTSRALVRNGEVAAFVRTKVLNKNTKECIVVDGKEGELFDAVPHLAGGPARVSYVGKINANPGVPDSDFYVVTPDAKSEVFGDVRELVTSPDGAVTAAVVRKGRSWHVWVNGTLGDPFANIERLAIAPDGKTVVYSAKDGPENFVVVGRERGTGLAVTWPFCFSADGKKVCFPARMGFNLWWKVRDVK